MSELKAHRFWDLDEIRTDAIVGSLYYLKSEADTVIAELAENHKKEVGQLLAEIAGLKSDIADLRDDKKLTDTILDERNGEISELKDKSEKLETELHAIQNKMCEDVFEGISPSHITCPPLKYAAYITNRARRNYYLALVRAAETGRRFWAKEQLFAMREGRKKDSEKAWKMEKRRERQAELFKAKADKFKELK